MVSSLYILLYAYEPSHISAEFIFENIHNMEIRCSGTETKLRVFDIIEDEISHRYKVSSLNNTLDFYCESFRILNVEVEDYT